MTSSPDGINCGATCSASFNYNTSVTLTATAVTGDLHRLERQRLFGYWQLHGDHGRSNRFRPTSI
ncbi:MAG: hypothetical protein NTV38_07355 [Chloroflexi bacterium]|nr:hypothetical protein [Chloroflexota bacterium]